MISGAQIKAARALLGESSRDLASRSGVSWATIKRFEETRAVPPSRSGTLERVQGALEGAGIRFSGDPANSPGVRLRKDRK